MNNKSNMSDFSSLSVVSGVDQFVKTVDAMNETIMVPSRLLNIELNPQNTDVPELLRGSSDAYALYSVLNSVKHNLIWGFSKTEDIPEKTYNNENISWITQTDYPSTAPLTKEEEQRCHARRISAVSMASVSSSETECERLSEGGDSGVEAEETDVNEVTESIRTHLLGLQKCLGRLKDTAKYITDIYQEEVSV